MLGGDVSAPDRRRDSRRSQQTYTAVAQELRAETPAEKDERSEEVVTPEDLHLLLEQTRLSEEAQSLIGMRQASSRQEVAKLLQRELNRISKWHGEEDARLLAQYAAGELDATQLERRLSERL